MLPGVVAKLERAQTLLGELQEDVKAWCDPRPPDLVQTIEEGWFVWRAKPGDEPPLTLAVRAGEVMNHLRSCLDHTVFGLVEANGKKPGKQHQYPITVTAKEFRSSSGRMLGGVPKPVVDLIESLQPYQKGGLEGDLLLALANLTNVDKHRTLLALQSVTVAGSVKFGRSKAVDVETEHFFEPHRMIDTPILFRARPLTRTTPPVVDLSVSLTAQVGSEWESDIMFGADTERGWVRLLSTELEHPLRYLRDELLPSFDPYLGDGTGVASA